MLEITGPYPMRVVIWDVFNVAYIPQERYTYGCFVI